VSEGERHLFRYGAFVAGLAKKGKGTINGFALSALHGVADVFPLVAAWEVCHWPLEAAMEDEPLVLVFQWEHTELIHQVAGPGGTAVGVSFREGRSACRGSCSHDIVGGVSHAKQLSNGSGCGNILGVHHAFLGLYVEAEWGGEVDQGAELDLYI
jgi:hypothetical protein